MKTWSRLVASVCLLSSVFILGCVASGPGGSAVQASTIGDVQDFTLKNLEDQDTSLQSVLKTHKAVLLNFWATWCPPCQEEIPGLIKLQAQHQASSFTVLGISVGESQKKVSSFVKKNGINYPILLDKEESVAESYGVVGIPTSYLLSSDGKVLGEYHAYTPELIADIEKALQ